MKCKTDNLKFIIILLVFLTGCATQKDLGYKPTTKPPTYIKTSVPGFYHTVKKGQTLWRISRMYSVDLEKLAAFNRLSNSCKIEVGQKIFIPDSFKNLKKSIPATDLITTFTWPYKGTLASCFKQPWQSVENQGIDILARNGGPINAAAAGNVIFTSESMRGYGKTIIIEHSGNFQTVYANNDKNIVKTGDYVKQGQVIAYAGTSGRTSRCVVHFEIRKNNKPQNPLLYLP